MCNRIKILVKLPIGSHDFGEQHDVLCVVKCEVCILICIKILSMFVSGCWIAQSRTRSCCCFDITNTIIKGARKKLASGE